MNNNLIVIENGRLDTYLLDDKPIWEVGRPSKGNNPDICLHSPTVSRRHGQFCSMDGIWFYTDYYGKNGTIRNEKHLSPGASGRKKPVMLADGDIFVFGGGDHAVINGSTIWAMYSTRRFDEPWRVIDTKEQTMITVEGGEQPVRFDHPQKGTVVECEEGIAIYMGEFSYAVGKLRLKLEND